MNHICFVVNKYPNKLEPYMLIFLQQLAWSMADMGKKVSVICPVPININLKYTTFPDYKVEETPKGSKIDVYFPKTIGFGQSHYILGKSPVLATTYFMEKAAERVIRKMKDKPDVLYGHFLAPSGIAVARLGKTFNIPSFFAYGESHDTIGQTGVENAKKEMESIKGVISVSTFLKNDIVDKGVVPENKVEVFPNAIRGERFKPYDKRQARRELNLPKDDIIVGFVGGFNERKGILRVCEAVENVSNVKLICAGAGEQKPFGEKCIFANALKPEMVPIFNSAADIFVLPTLLEGCSNAVVEAMACGLPIISSNLPFNDDILDESCAIRVDPNNIKEIEDAIKYLADNPQERELMSQKALEKASTLTLDVRAKNIIEFIDRKCENK